MPPLLTDVFQSPDLDMSNISGGWFRKWLKSIRRILLLIHANSIACWSSLSLCCGINHGTGDSPVWWKFNVSMLASIREPRQKKIHPYRPYMSISHIFLYLFASDHIWSTWDDCDGVKLGTWRTWIGTWRTWIGSMENPGLSSQMMASVAPGCTFNCVKESKVATWRVNGVVIKNGR